MPGAISISHGLAPVGAIELIASWMLLKSPPDGATRRRFGNATARVWKAQRFSWWMTRLLHRFPEDPPFDRRLQQAEFDFLAGSNAAQAALAENYVGLGY